MAATPSHRLKLQRAEKHLVELDALVAGVRQPRPYPVTEAFDPKRQEWIYRLRLGGIEPPETFPVVFGDFLFNLRSALDHLIVAIAPKKLKRTTSFPICQVDPLLSDGSGEYRDADAARAWLSRTKGLPADCIAALQRLQPYQFAAQGPDAVEGHALAILSALQNADKHRQLVAVLHALTEAFLTIDGKKYRINLPHPRPAIEDGAEIYASKRQVDMKVEGTASIGVGRPDALWDVFEFAAQIRQAFADAVLPWLEPFLPEER